MPDLTAEDPRAALLDRLEDALQTALESRHDCGHTWNGGLLAGAEATLGLLAEEGRLIEPGDVQGVVAIVIGQLRDARAELAALRADRFREPRYVRPVPGALSGLLGAGEWMATCPACAPTWLATSEQTATAWATAHTCPTEETTDA